MNNIESEKYKNLLDSTIDSKRKSQKEISNLILINIEHIRAFCSSLLTINVGLIGAIVAVYITDSNKIISPGWIFTGLSILMINSIFIIFYSSFVLINENEKLYTQYNFLGQTHNEIISLLHNYHEKGESFDSFDDKYLIKMKSFSVTEKENFDKDNKKVLSSNWVYLFSTLFFIGLVFLLAGIIDWHYFYEIFRIKNYCSFYV